MSVISPGDGVDLIERALREGIDLDGVDITVAARLHAGGGVGLFDAGLRVGRLGGLPLASRERFELAGHRQDFGNGDDLDRLWRIVL